MTDKGFHLFDECAARCVHLSLKRKSAPLLPEGTVKCTHVEITEINKSGAIVKIRI